MNEEYKDWQCEGCKFIIYGYKSECSRCHLRKGEQPLPSLKRPPDWMCPTCNFLVFGSKTQCSKCKLNKGEEPERKKYIQSVTRERCWWCPSCRSAIFNSMPECQRCGSVCIDLDPKNVTLLPDKEEDTSRCHHKTKYIKLVTDKDLVINGKQHHFTFAYFGDNETNPRDLLRELQNVPSFVLRAVKEDMFGEGKQLPVVVYEVIGEKEREKVQEGRARLLSKAGEEVCSLNFINWRPHLTRCSGTDVKKYGLEYVRVTGVRSNNENDESFTYSFEE